MRVLYLEDEPLQRRLGEAWLESAGHIVRSYADGQAALKALERETFDIAIMDWEVPALSGPEVLARIRHRGLGIPVMFATSHAEEERIVQMLRQGADDYLVKPLRRGEFLARVESLCRRASRQERDLVTLDLPPYRVDFAAPAIAIDGRVVELRPRLEAIALLLFRKHGQLVSRAEIYEKVWGTEFTIETRTVDTHISQLRKALQLDGGNGLRLESVYQHGYRLSAKPRATEQKVRHGDLERSDPVPPADAGVA